MIAQRRTEQKPRGFGEARRLATNPLAAVERRCLVWMAARLPRWINSDHLTALALGAMALTGLSYVAARFTRLGLVLAVGGLIINWFGDSLDGTVARLRRHERPRYGFYVDHVVDCIGIVLLVAGLGLSGYMTPLVAACFLVAYFMLSIEVYLATYCLSVFRLSFWGVGPTELRILLAIGTVSLASDPRVGILGRSYRLFDVGGVVAIVCIAVTLAATVIRHVQILYRAEPIPRPVPQDI
jgi:phosphatidylglycerophosphate synthase